MRTARIPTAVLAVTLALAAAACGDSGSDEHADTAATTSTIAAPRTTATGATTQTTATPTTAPAVARPTRVVDERIAVGAGRLHLHCNGRGDTTVLLIPGWGNSGDQGWAPVQPAIGQRTRVCTYDRFGLGTSDAATTNQTFTTQANDLHELLEKAGEPGPYVVVGHSFGGAAAVTFTSRYADEVVGLMLVDASPPTWPAALCAVPADAGPAAGEYQTTCGVFRHPERDAERLDAFPAFDEVAEIDTLGDVPMTVMTAAERTVSGLNDREVARLTKVWNDGVAGWAALSTAARVVSVENTGHYIQGERPNVVITEVTKLVP
jgi:pimeloyl-ACP methyl ester carboxylesterase